MLSPGRPVIPRAVRAGVTVGKFNVVPEGCTTVPVVTTPAVPRAIPGARATPFIPKSAF